ncbi:MAG: hypothetical protein M1131_08210 [Actinobacteria bacterium]|jgi:isopropylmalate/homocitrate/citramalate synthase|nr:hypothetical protein [Actinomycetota bacterium]MCL6095156.1 hypothetical protein [Actinomycetota bacterium]
MIDPQLLWTGELNKEAIAEGLVSLPNQAVHFYDTTLRDGEQTVGVVLNPEDKLAIAQALDLLGVERIEAGFPRVSPEDAEAMRLIVHGGLKAEVWGFCRAVMEDVDSVLEAGAHSSVIEAPVSDRKIEAYGLTREVITDRVLNAVSHAANSGVRVCFFGVDSTRADMGFLESILKRSLEAGASEIAVVDTLGIASPESAFLLMKRVRQWVGADVPLHWHGHNDFGLATAVAISALNAGATWLHCTVNGMGERAGNTNLGELAMALEALYGVETGLHLEHLNEVSALVRQRSRYCLERWKPVTGEALFDRESGAVASQFHVPSSIEPYAPEVVGARRRVVLGKKSGLDSIRIKLDELGLQLDRSEWPSLLEQVKQLGVQKRGLVDDDEFAALVTRIRG